MAAQGLRGTGEGTEKILSPDVLREVASNGRLVVRASLVGAATATVLSTLVDFPLSGL
jgi:hypothetical protein